MAFVKQVDGDALQFSSYQYDGFIEVELPEDKTYRQAWRLVDGAVVIDEAVKAEIDLTAWKANREEAVSQITVTTESGKSFDGDEKSQGRMARAITSSEPGETTTWVMANNLPDTVTHEELKEALRLSGEAQTSLWV